MTIAWDTAKNGCATNASFFWRGEEFFEEEAGEAGGIVADDAVFFEEIVEDDAVAESLQSPQIDGDGIGAACAIALGHFGRNGLAIGYHPIDNAARRVMLDGAQMIGEGVAGGFAGLGHKIGDVHARRFRFGDGVCDVRYQQVGKDAGVERAGAEQNQIGFVDGFEGLGKRACGAREERELLDGLAAGGDAGLTVDAASIFESGNEGDVGDGRRKNLAADGENFAAEADGFGKITGDVGERCEEEIAEIVADEAAAGVEAILKETAEKSFVLRQGDHAIADVSGGQDAVFATQAAGTAAVIGYGDDSGEAGDGMVGVGGFVAAANDQLLQAAKNCREARAAAEGDDVEAVGELRGLGYALFHETLRV